MRFNLSSLWLSVFDFVTLFFEVTKKKVWQYFFQCFSKTSFYKYFIHYVPTCRKIIIQKLTSQRLAKFSVKLSSHCNTVNQMRIRFYCNSLACVREQLNLCPWKRGFTGERRIRGSGPVNDASSSSSIVRKLFFSQLSTSQKF